MWKQQFIIFNAALLFCFSICSNIKAEAFYSTAKADSIEFTREKFSVSFGAFLSGQNTDLVLGSKQYGLGIGINLEDALGLRTSSRVLRSEIDYHFGKSQRHLIRFGYFGFFRSSTKVLESDLEIGDTIFQVGTKMYSTFDLQIFRGAYDYAFYQDERVRLGLSIGFFVMPIRFSTTALGTSGEVAEFIAPLPVFGLNAGFAITPKWSIKQNIELLYLEISDFTGKITDINIRLEYTPWKHFGMGLGYDSYQLFISKKQDGKRNMDFVGTVKSGYTGLLIYAKYFF